MDFDNPSYFSVPKEGQSPSTSSSSVVMDCHQPSTSFERSTKRSFMRSISSNSADSNKELLIMGEPRLSDLAPDLAYRHSSRSESMRSRREEARNDFNYLPLPTSEEQADELSGDEVFLTEESARYYNVSAMKRTNQRRHSIGTFVMKERSNSMVSSTRSFKEDFPQRERDDIDDHSLRHASFPRKRCSRCTNGK
ncbi:unnamed protein product [Acanthoscelides obtectus]|uniref:Uncharacterized protein n=1 Tax=Acanthoscelides obtectus TaxID=200917 RepID=A0A9P0P644_ACAOB|nr:unnamed protein product [Acanthoscelides obtectus]CAK1662368.1 hypothetical protein AOBTE_LOCUS23107 [Acanthoscelides obtectus]